jgi:2'-deoxynucleoside 5'-phosphate N-hydrolase
MATIYFSGSISGGREDLQIYQKLVGELQAAGHRVLAGSIVSASVGDGGEQLTDREIFDRDLGWIEEVARAKGILVAEVSKPSTGVGYEIAAARYRYGIPVVCLYRGEHTKRCSAMIAGDAGIELIHYSSETLPEATARLVEIVGRIANKPETGVV